MALFHDPIAVLVPDDPAGNPPSWDRLEGRPPIAYDKDWRDGCVAGIRYYLARMGMAEPAYRVRESSTVPSMIDHGLGVSILPELAIGSLPPGVR
ncbi:MAG: LysR substrate-binding domain-containing protein, partial [Deinococcales bacterium]